MTKIPVTMVLLLHLMFVLKTSSEIAAYYWVHCKSKKETAEFFYDLVLLFIFLSGNIQSFLKMCEIMIVYLGSKYNYWVKI